MLSAQCDELRKCAEALQDAIDSLNSGRITHEGLTDAMHYGINGLRDAADTIWELRNKLCDMVDARERARVLESENAKLRAERDEWHRVAVSKQDIIDHMRDARAENAKLRELFYEAWEWMQRVRYDRSIRANEMDEIGVKAVKLGFPDYELGIEVDE